MAASAGPTSRIIRVEADADDGRAARAGHRVPRRAGGPGLRRRHDDGASRRSRGAALREQAPDAARPLEEARRVEQLQLRRARVAENRVGDELAAGEAEDVAVTGVAACGP